MVPVGNENKNNELLSLVKSHLGSGIVYVTLQQSAEQVASFLSTHGINAQPYHAGFDTDKRQNIQADFMQGKEGAEQALKDITAAYISAAKEKGFIK